MLLMLPLAALAAQPAPFDHFVTVDGARYRVRVTGETVAVFKKSMVVKDTIEERDRQRRAVQAATGCQITDELQRDARLRGKLSCPSAN